MLLHVFLCRCLDNVSTAINIGISCNLLEADFEKQGRLFQLDKDQSTSIESIQQVLNEAHTVVDETRAKEPNANFGLAVHSDAWKKLMNEEDESKDSKKTPKLEDGDANRIAALDSFFKLTQSCRSVIACRLEPKEKAQIVEEMKRRTGKVCLAIGDGNNGQQQDSREDDIHLDSICDSTVRLT